jgi:y4mF family transcriptional regulator
MKALNIYIRKARKKEGLTQEELAAKAGVGLSFVREIEAGKPIGQLERLNAILAMFNKQLDICDKDL